MTKPLRTATLILLATTTLTTGCLGGKSSLIAEQQRLISDLNERGLTFAEQGRNADAQKLLQEALRLAASLDDRHGQIMTLLNQARLARHNNRPEVAEQHVDQALQLAVGTRDYADAAQEKSLQELLTGRLEQATRWADAALAAEQGNLRGRRLNLLARIVLLKGDTAGATRLAELALSANSGDGLELERANSLRMLGLLKTQAGQLDKAEEMLQEALKLDKQQAVPSRIAADLDALATLAGRKQEPARKQEYLNRAKLVRENSQPIKRP